MVNVPRDSRLTCGLMALWLMLAALLVSLAPPAMGAGLHDLCVQQALQADTATPTEPPAPQLPGDISHLSLCSACAGCTSCSHAVALAANGHPVRGAAPSLAEQRVPADQSQIRTRCAAHVSARGPPSVAA